MAYTGTIKEHMEVIGADGVHVGTVDKLEGDRIKLTKRDSGQGAHEGHHHYLSKGLVAAIEGDKVRLSATAANAFMFQEENDGSARLVADAPQARPTAPQSTAYKPADAQPKRRPAAKQGGSDLDWTTIGIGAAAVGAVAGAALLARGKGKKDTAEFDLRLQTDESMRLISSAKVEGTPVMGRDGARLGQIESFMVDKYSGRVAYAVMSFGGTMGFGESLFPLPWSALTYDTGSDGYVLSITKEQLANAPKFGRSEAPEFSKTYRQDVGRYYGRSSI